MSDPVTLDVLAFGAHPDDVELFCGGTVCLLAEQGYRVGIVDLTRGELGSRGSAELREEEAAEAANIAGVVERVNLELADGNISNTSEAQTAVIRQIRRFRPRILIANAAECRHPDHGAASRLVVDSAFYSGLRRVSTGSNGGNTDPWRPDYLLQYVQAVPFEPTIVVDVTRVWDKRLASLRAFRSQFFNESYETQSDEPETYVSNPLFFKSIEARARMHGQRIGVEFGEGFRCHSGPLGIGDLVATLQRKPHK